VGYLRGPEPLRAPPPQPSPASQGYRMWPAALTSLRLRGEVGIGALFAQISGEGASPRV